MFKNKKLLHILFFLMILSLWASACSGGTAPNNSNVEPPTRQPDVNPPDASNTQSGEDQTDDVQTEIKPDVPLADFETVSIVTTANDVVGIGTYVAAEPYAISGDDTQPGEQIQAFIMPFGIYPNMHIQSIDEFSYESQTYRIQVEEFTFQWRLETPDGSNAALLHDYLALFLADVPGDYVLTLTATDEFGNSNTTSWTVRAANYVGNKELDSQTEAPHCAACHRNEVAAWTRTVHATMLERGVNGTLSDHYGENCIWCHTTGFNNRPEAANNGFDDRMGEYGWQFPGNHQSGVFGEFVDGYPDVAALANIQCESCHGPGSDHSGEGPIGTSLEYGVCAQCHAEDPYHVFPQQWELSRHAEADATAFWYPVGEGREDCVQCHSGKGYIDFVTGFTPDSARSDYQVITCAVCHDPHNAFSPNQLRVFGAVILPDGSLFEEFGPAATCMTCHNQRYDANTVIADALGLVGFKGGEFTIPHYSASAELLVGSGGYTWDQRLPISVHVAVLDQSCIDCHMAPTPGIYDNGTPDDTSDDIPFPGNQTVGEHTFAMTSPVDGTENIQICQECHEEADSFVMEANGDYDGDGTVESNDDELLGLIELIQAELLSAGVVFLEEYPYYQVYEGASEDVLGGVWNYHLLYNNMIPAHNLKYLVSLAQLTYEKLADRRVPGADLIQ